MKVLTLTLLFLSKSFAQKLICSDLRQKICVTQKYNNLNQLRKKLVRYFDKCGVEDCLDEFLERKFTQKYFKKFENIHAKNLEYYSLKIQTIDSLSSQTKKNLTEFLKEAQLINPLSYYKLKPQKFISFCGEDLQNAKATLVLTNQTKLSVFVCPLFYLSNQSLFSYVSSHEIGHLIDAKSLEAFAVVPGFSKLKGASKLLDLFLSCMRKKYSLDLIDESELSADFWALEVFMLSIKSRPGNIVKTMRKAFQSFCPGRPVNYPSGDLFFNSMLGSHPVFREVFSCQTESFYKHCPL